MDSIILVNGKGNGGNEKTIAIVSWFFAGYNLADTVLAISHKAIIIYASERKSNSLSIQSPFWPI
jgi:nucleosome binding factor SPN SPT16 subunit